MRKKNTQILWLLSPESAVGHGDNVSVNVGVHLYVHRMEKTKGEKQQGM